MRIVFKVVVVLCWCVLGQLHPVEAADKELLDILLTNGAITKEQYDHLIKKKTPLTKDDVVISLKKGLEIKTKDENFKAAIGGRLHAQAAFHGRDHVGGEEASDGLEIRRGRLYMRGVLYRDWKYKAELDFAGNGVEIKDFWLAYTGLGGLDYIGIGHQKQPYSLEVEMSTNDIPFIERALDYAFTQAVVDRALGLRLQTHGKYWFAAGGIYGQSIDSPETGDEGWGTAGRFIFSPLHDDRRVVHLGIRGAYRVPGDQDRTARFRFESTHQSNLYLVNTGKIRRVDNTVLAGAEAAFVYGPVSLEGEYTHAVVARKGGIGDLDFDGFHIQATWSLTGESRAAAYRIKSGEFKRLKAHQYFYPAVGSWGAWEVAARYGWIDLNDQDVRGGKAQDISVALNWYLNRNIRFMLDYTHVLDITHALGSKWNNQADNEADGLDIVQVRGELIF